MLHFEGPSAPQRAFKKVCAYVRSTGRERDEGGGWDVPRLAAAVLGRQGWRLGVGVRAGHLSQCGVMCPVGR